MKVISATLQQPVPLKGGIASDKTINDAKIKGVEMEVIPEFLVVSIPDKNNKEITHDTLVPIPNCAGIHLADGELKKFKAKKLK